MIESGWTSFIYDYAYKFDNLTVSSLYFITWDILMSFIIVSLIKGIVLEVFMVCQVKVNEGEKDDDDDDDDGTKK